MILKCQDCQTVKEMGFYSICKLKSHPATVSWVLTEYMRFPGRDNDVITQVLSLARAWPFVLAAKAPIHMGKCEEAQVTPPY